ncbi:FAD/NAD(P)-binding protein [Gluconacetobacter tumulisoli]|uniref:SidA/IucD/PvdA family monooxygenase n=1 Tax=Gluconacetobacter tumulisoli TaxID=1286189 RepID=A0A7W4K5T9_9PROT|nr:FAD/NAD(P)-binding protein [Gluconacetobacter tumulisoli]MBB2200937.1 SidA/IucD/PvdA family monooxygenase [Gluconacetobacter tumulisoli]
MTSRSHRVAIIGGGFTGAAVAYHLTGAGTGTGTVAAPVVVFEPRPTLGAGVAYGAQDPNHRINVPAARMSLSTDEPDDFRAWLERDGVLEGDPEARLPNGAVYPARSVFGRYIAARLAPRLAEGRVEHRRARVTAVRPDEAGGWRIDTDDGRRTSADIVVIATSHPPPAPPACLADLAVEAKASGGTMFIADPWAVGALDAIGTDDRVLIVGTGLSMADVVSTLDAAGHRGPITALSRRGQRSHGDLSDNATAWGDFSTGAEGSARGLLRRVRRTLRDNPDQPWQTIFNALRRQAGPIWAALNPAEQRRLVRHLRPFWDVRRFRIAPQAERVLDRRIAAGMLRIEAGRLTGAARRAGSFDVAIRPRGEAERRMTVDAIVTTTGPDHARILSSQPFLADLARQGYLERDPAGLGLHTDRAGHAVSSGRAHPTLLVAGPLSRGTFGELMGLPEVTVNAQMVAATIREAVGPQRIGEGEEPPYALATPKMS